MSISVVNIVSRLFLFDCGKFIKVIVGLLLGVFFLLLSVLNSYYFFVIWVVDPNGEKAIKGLGIGVKRPAVACENIQRIFSERGQRIDLLGQFSVANGKAVSETHFQRVPARLFARLVMINSDLQEE